jgi:hypothetical protein
VEDKRYEQLVLLGDGQVMAIMAVDILMLALRPRVKRRFHKMAAYAELWIVLCKVIELEGNHSAANNDYQQ